jgi:CBS domain-containing protein
MTGDPITIRPHASLSEAIHLLTSNQIDCLPVTGEDREIYGIITKSDLLQVSFVVQRWLETRAPRLHG